MDPGVRSHGMKVDPPGYLWSKYECFLMSGSWDIPHLRNSVKNIVVNSMNVTDAQTNEGTNKRTKGWTERSKLYTPRYKCRGYKYSHWYHLYWSDVGQKLIPAGRSRSNCFSSLDKKHNLFSLNLFSLIVIDRNEDGKHTLSLFSLTDLSKLPMV